MTVPVLSAQTGTLRAPSAPARCIRPGARAESSKAVDGVRFSLSSNSMKMSRLWARDESGPDFGRTIRAFKTNRDRLKNNDDFKRIFEEWLATFPDRESAIKVLDAERVPLRTGLQDRGGRWPHPHLRGRKTVAARQSTTAMGRISIFPACRSSFFQPGQTRPT